jgi:hypothetical protein
MAAQKAARMMHKGGGDGSNQYQKATGSRLDPIALVENTDPAPISPRPITLAGHRQASCRSGQKGGGEKLLRLHRLSVFR